MSRLARRIVLLASLVAALPAAGAELDCLIEPWESIGLSAPIEGVVEEVLVGRGDRVKKGQAVARLESSSEEAGVALARSRARATGLVASAKARLAYAQRSLKRQQSLRERDVVSASEMDEALSAKEVAEAELLEAREAKEQDRLDLRRVEARLERRTIRSPIDGVVVERILAPGEYADPPQVMRLAQLDPLRVEVFAPLALFGKIEPGMKAEVIPEEPVSEVQVATVTVVDRVVEAASGTFGVRLELPNPDYTIPAGLKCRLRFPDDPAPGPAPAAAGVAP